MVHREGCNQWSSAAPHTKHQRACSRIIGRYQRSTIANVVCISPSPTTEHDGSNLTHPYPLFTYFRWVFGLLSVFPLTLSLLFLSYIYALTLYFKCSPRRFGALLPGHSLFTIEA